MRPVRVWWNQGYNRVVMFWLVSFTMTSIVIVVIATEAVDWDKTNNGFVSTNELSRSFLASAILIFDLLIVMQVFRLDAMFELFF